jgi:hypothetical protein
MNFAVTPYAVWQVGHWMGGQGTLSMTYVGGTCAFAAFSESAPPNETPSQTIARIDLEFAVATLMMPVTSAVVFEIMSHFSYARWRDATQAGNVSFGVAPTYDRRGGLDGAMSRLSLRF